MNICLPANGKVFKTEEKFLEWAKKNHHLDTCPVDVEGWMGNWAAFYSTAKGCQQKTAQYKNLMKGSRKAWANYTRCTKKRCRDVDASRLRKQIMKKCKHSDKYTRKYFKCFEKESTDNRLPQKEKLEKRCATKECGNIKKKAIKTTHKITEFLNSHSFVAKERTEEACSTQPSSLQQQQQRGLHP